MAPPSEGVMLNTSLPLQKIKAKPMMTLDKAIWKYIDTITVNGTKQIAISGVIKLLTYLGDNKPIDTITTDDLENWRKWLADDYKTTRGKFLSGSSQRVYIAMAKNMFKWLVKERYISHSPFDGGSWGPMFWDEPDITQLKAMKPEHFQLMYNKAIEIEDWLAKVCLSFLEATGVRIGSLIKLKMSNLYPKQNYAIVFKKGRRIKTRTGSKEKQYMVAFHQRCATDLREYIELDRGKRMQGYLLKEFNGKTVVGSSFVRRRFQHLAELCNIAEYPHNPHSLRHMFAITRLRSGVPPAHVSQMLGHSSVAITLEHYGKILDPGDLINVYEQALPNYA